MSQRDSIPVRAIFWRAAPLLPLAAATLWLGVQHGAWFVTVPLALSTVLFAGAFLKQVRPIDRLSRLEEVNRSLAVIEFAPDGTILHANNTFLELMGYSLDEVQGRNHSIFVAEDERTSPEYLQFWQTLRAGEFQRAEFQRFAKDGSPRWISASYNPIFGNTGKVVKVIKFATDVSRQHQLLLDNELVQFTLDSTSSCVAVADSTHTVTYFNNAMRTLLSGLAGDLRSVVPGFAVDRVVGSASQDLHPLLTGPALLGAAGTEPKVFQENIGSHLIRFSLVPIIDKEGARVGTVIKFADCTEEVATERELQGVVERANAGDLDVRIELDGKSGALRNLSQGVNDLLDVCERVIDETKRVFGAMAKGDLSQTIDSDYDGAFAQLKVDANSTVARLVDVITNIRGAIEPVRQGAQEIADGNINLSERTEHQASNLERTAANLDTLTGTVRRNAEHAQEASELARAAREEAVNGGDVARDAVTAMTEINESSQKIADIVGVIDEIAFQTNLLALNAAVEAARAGEQGRGFAVVANEVRNLAGRSASSAKEIKHLIEDSERKVQQGSKLVHNSGEVLDRIVERVRSVSSIVGEIAAASQEQSEGINNVNTAISRMDDMTQQNTAMVQQAAAASKTVGEQAARLSNLIEFFDAGASHAPVPVANVTKEPYTGPERRSAKRPWSDPPGSAQAKSSG